MYATISEIPRFKFDKVHFYTVEFEERKNAEFFDFVERMEKKKEYLEDLQEILKVIEKIGTKFGAKAHNFKHERHGEALPTNYPNKKEHSGDFGLRLYCIRISEEIVILLNGDQKTNSNPEKCKNVSRHFREMQKIAQKINEDIKDKHIEIIGKDLIFNDDYEFEIRN